MVKVCQFSRFIDELTKALEENNIEYTSKECIGRCDLCMKVPFVQKDHEFIYDESIDKLIKKLVGQLD
jgi:uncharacterized protein YuzB (UPF0349 family)